MKAMGLLRGLRVAGSSTPEPISGPKTIITPRGAKYHLVWKSVALSGSHLVSLCLLLLAGEIDKTRVSAC